MLVIIVGIGLAGCYSKSLTRQDVATQEPHETGYVATIQSLQSQYHAISFSPDGNTFLVSIDDGLTLFDTENFEEIRRQPFDLYVSSITYSADDERIITCHFDNTLTIWDAQDLEPLFSWRASEKLTITQAWFSPDSKYIVGDVFDRTTNFAIIWEADTGKPVYVLDSYIMNDRRTRNYVLVSWEMENVPVVAAGYGNMLTVYYPESDTSSYELVHEIAYDEAAWSPTGTLLATGGKEVIIWDIETGTQLRTLPLTYVDMTWIYMTNLSWSPDETKIAVTLSNGTVLILDAISGELIYELSEAGAFSDLVWSPDSLLLATSSRDTGIFVWNIDSGEIVYQLSDEIDN